MGKRIRGNSGNNRYFFVKPVVKENVYKTAKRLIGMERVKEVAITEGDYGFVIKAAPLNDSQSDYLFRKIMEVVGGSSNNAVCLFQYSKK